MSGDVQTLIKAFQAQQQTHNQQTQKLIKALSKKDETVQAHPPQFSELQPPTELICWILQPSNLHVLYEKRNKHSSFLHLSLLLPTKSNAI
ncbi:hypothetical protein RRG08_030240 [Elysia crispata]|uniref:Uncharacterized protein n=1 Tax=Elysia crispata TaxID=231223 RepID=A0AAE1AIH5_9GAST|nr:hypothetical protein RRG08_030240 [Elysia crispata]